MAREEAEIKELSKKLTLILIQWSLSSWRMPTGGQGT